MPRSKKLSDQMRAESRAAILTAASRLFAEIGYFKCRVADIAQAAAMSQGNVYWYFSTKQEILQAVLEDGFAAQQRVLDEALTLPGSGYDRLQAVINRFIALYAENGNFLTILLSLMAHGGETLIEQMGFDMREIGSGYHRSLGAILKQAQDEGTILELDIDLLVMFVFGFLNGMLITYNDMWPHLPPDQLLKAVLRLVGGEQPKEQNNV